MKENKTNRVTIRLTPKEHQELLEITEQTGTTMTKILRSALLEFIEKRKIN
jgi:predicted DNA-binding protein